MAELFEDLLGQSQAVALLLQTSPQQQRLAPAYLFCGPDGVCLLYTSPSPRDLSTSRMPSSA